MSERLNAWWRMRTQREQRLLLVMFALAGVVLAWLLVVRPLQDSYSAAKERHGAAVVALAEARARAGAIGALERARPATLSAPIEAIVARSASDAGFTPSDIRRESANAVGVSIGAARPQALFGWVEQVESGQGLIVERFTATANADRTLAAHITFRTRGR